MHAHFQPNRSVHALAAAVFACRAFLPMVVGFSTMVENINVPMIMCSNVNVPMLMLFQC